MKNNWLVLEETLNKNNLRDYFENRERVIILVKEGDYNTLKFVTFYEGNKGDYLEELKNNMEYELSEDYIKNIIAILYEEDFPQFLQRQNFKDFQNFKDWETEAPVEGEKYILLIGAEYADAPYMYTHYSWYTLTISKFSNNDFDIDKNDNYIEDPIAYIKLDHFFNKYIMEE